MARAGPSAPWPCARPRRPGASAWSSPASSRPSSAPRRRASTSRPSSCPSARSCATRTGSSKSSGRWSTSCSRPTARCSTACAARSASSAAGASASAPLAGPAGELAEAGAHLEEAARALRSLVDRLEADPARLEAVEERLAELERLSAKYGRDAAGLGALAGELEAEIAALEADEASLDGLAEAVASARSAVLAAGGDLRRARKTLKPKLVRAVEAALLGARPRARALRPAPRPALAGGGGRGEDELVRAAFEADRELFGERGIDRIEFLLAANPGQPLEKLRHVASGGETARIMLALRSALARRGAGRARVLVFDEIDAGVGGRLGPAVGEHLKALGAHHQILCVTHLPAVAALADRHLRVVKEVERGRTRTRSETLAGEARVLEIADMIAGGAEQETARAEARRLLGQP